MSKFDKYLIKTMNMLYDIMMINFTLIPND